MPKVNPPPKKSGQLNVQSNADTQRSSGNAPPLQLVTPRAARQHLDGLPVQASTSRQNAPVFTPPINPPPPSTVSAMPPPLDTPAMSAGSQPDGAYERLTPEMMKQWLGEKYTSGPPAVCKDMHEYLKIKTGRKLNGIYVLASLCYIYGCDKYAPVQPTEADNRQANAINNVLPGTNQVTTPDEICRSLSAQGEPLTIERVCQLLELMRRKDLIFSNSFGAIGKNSMVARTTSSNGAQSISLEGQEKRTVTVMRFILNYLKENPGVSPSWSDVNKHVKVSYKTYSYCMSAICGQARCRKTDLMGKTNETPPGSQTLPVSSTIKMEKSVKHGRGATRQNRLEVSSAARAVAAASSEKSETNSVKGDPPPLQSSFVGPNGVWSGQRRFDDALTEKDSCITEINCLYPLSEYDPASGLTWYRQGPNQCLQSSLWNLLGKRWVNLPTPGRGQQTAAGELALACEVVPGQVRMTPDKSPIKQLFVPQRMLGPLAAELAELPSGFVLYRGATGREAARHEIAGHYVALRQEKGHWYLIDSLGSGPVEVNLADYLRNLPHGLMAAIPVNQGVATSKIWLTLEAMAKNPRLESLSLMLNFDRTPQDILGWLADENLGPKDLCQADVVARYLASITGKYWSLVQLELPDILAAQPRRPDDPYHYGQGNNARSQVQTALPIDTLLGTLNGTDRDSFVLCLGTRPFHLLTYRRDGDWFCMVEPPSAPGQDLYSPALVEQPLREVMERYLAEVAKLHSELPPERRGEADAVAQRTKVDVIWQAE